MPELREGLAQRVGEVFGRCGAVPITGVVIVDR